MLCLFFFVDVVVLEAFGHEAVGLFLDVFFELYLITHKADFLHDAGLEHLIHRFFLSPLLFPVLLQTLQVLIKQLDLHHLPIQSLKTVNHILLHKLRNSTPYQFRLFSLILDLHVW